MKILYLLPLLKNTGPANVVVSLVNGMKNTTNEVIVCTFLGVEDNYQNIFTKKNVIIIELNGFNLKSLYTLWKLIRLEKVDILHSHGLLPDLASAAISLFNSVKNISTVHCNLRDNYKNEYQLPKGFIYFRLHKLALFFIKKITYVSASITASPSDTVIYNGINKKQSKIITSDSINLIYAGRLIPSKNITFLLDCLSYINSQTDHKVTLHVYGDGELLPTLTKQALPNVILYGFVEHYLKNIPENAIMVNPSLFEGMPMAVLEALSAGVPVALSTIPPHLEINENISCGITLFDNTPQSFQVAIHSLINSNNQVYFNKEQMAEQFDCKFSDTSMVNQYLIAYSSL